MGAHVISRRIQDIIQYIYDAHYPSKKKIIEFLVSRDFVVSPRTFDRDLERIRADFGLDILYNKVKDGYYINEQGSVKVSSFFNFLEIVTVADIFRDSLANSNKILEYVSFDDSKSFKGIDNLRSILIAIREKRKLIFNHENYLNKTIKNYSISPLLLKEYENRWYVIGVPDQMKETRTFGIDRLSNIEIGSLSKVKKKQYSKDLQVFDTIIGLDHENNKAPFKIQLLVKELHINYLKSLPLHHSQVIHSENIKGQYTVDYYLFPNYEFKSQILKMGNSGEVLKPLHLRREIADELKKILNKYKNN